MKKLSRGFKWMWMFSKRLYKKPTFLLILILIPALVLGYSMVDKQDSGMFTVALACVDPEDPIAASMEEKLLGSSQLIRFHVYENPQQAEDVVASGKADAAWIFLDNMEGRIHTFLETRSKADAVVRIVEREQTVPSLITREKLTGVVFEACAKPFYLSYLRQHVPELVDISDADLTAWFDEVNLNGQLFEFSDVSDQQSEAGEFLMTPVRGLLAVVTVLAGLATTMYYKQDEASGTFSWVPEQMHFPMELGYQLVSIFHMLLAVALALGLSGLHGSIGKELPVYLLFALVTAGFCMAAGKIFHGLRTLGVALPLLTIGMIVICPVFYDLGSLRFFQYLLPPTYFVNGLYNEKYLVFGAVYVLLSFLLAFVLSKLRRSR